MVVRPSRSIVRSGTFATLALVACSGSYVAAQIDAGSGVADAAVVPISPVDAGWDGATIVPVGDASDAAPAPPFCTGRELFCDSFDEGGVPPTERWSYGKSAAGPLDYDDTTFVSPSRSLRVRIEPDAGERSSLIGKDLDIPSGNARISFDIRLDRPMGTFGEIDPVTIIFGPNPSGVSFQVFGLVVLPTESRLEVYRSFADGGSVGGSSPVGIGTLGAFHRAVFTLRSFGGQVSCSLSIDGQTAVMQSVTAEPIRRISLEVGAPYTSNANIAATIRFDNVLVEPL